MKNLTAAVLYGGGLFGMHVALLIAVILYIPSRAATMPFRAGVLIVSIWAIVFAISKGFAFYKGKLWIALAVFWAFYGLSIFMEPMFMLQQSRMNYSLYAFGICAIPTCGFLISTNRSNLQSGLIWLFAGAFVAGALSIALYGNASLHGSGRAKGGDFIGDFVAIGPLLLSYAGSSLVVLGSYWAFVRESLPSVMIRYTIAGVFVAIGAYLMALGASRGPVIAVFIPCALFMVCRVKKASDIIMLIVSSVILVGMGFVLLFFADMMGSALVMRLKSLMHIQETYMSGGVGIGRIIVYQEAFKQFLGNPILGNGLYCRAVLSYPHNFILEAYMTTGVFGGTAFLIYFSTCVSRAIKIIRHFPVYSWVSLFFLHYAVYCQFSSGIIMNHYFWYSSAMVIAVYEFASKERPLIRRRQYVR
ncbi:MAG: O-antigen ligase family protein [Opitutae bacterium]|nr:O-antigen ligase family protein [Opitutae bacterium]